MIFGENALENFKPASDIDITLKGPNLNTTILHSIELELDDLLLPFKIDLSIFDHIKQPELISHIGRRGKCLYKKEPEGMET
jgi:predicted nucleotidyltransferase